MGDAMADSFALYAGHPAVAVWYRSFYIRPGGRTQPFAQRASRSGQAREKRNRPSLPTSGVIHSPSFV